MKKRFLSLLLCACMVCAAIPFTAVNVTAAGTDATTAIQSGIGGLAYGDAVYYGTYQSGDTTYNVPWYIIGSNGGVKKTLDANPESLFLLSQYTLGSSSFRNGDDWGYYNYSTVNKTEDSSKLKAAMEGLYKGGGTTLFTALEQGAVKQTTLTGDSMYSATTIPDVATYLFPLSWNEARGIGWNTAILKTKSIDSSTGSAGGWWLRFSYFNFGAYYVKEDGSGGDYVDDFSTSLGVRPAFNLNLNSVLFTSAAEGGKSATGMDSTLTAVATTTTDAWKLTLLDADRSFSAGATAVNGNTLTVSYSGAKTGANEYISAVIKDTEGNVKYYGRLKNIAAAGDANGTVDVTLPTGLDSASDTLYIFSEQYKGDYKTDYASALVKISLPYVITNTLMNITSSNTSSYRLISDTADYTATLTAGAGYILPAAIEVTAGGTALTSGTEYTYNSGTGELTIPAGSITGDIVITAAGVAKTYTIELSTTPATNPPELSFSGTYGYTAIAAQTVTVKNTGNQSVTLTQPTATSFIVTLQAGSSLTLTPGGTAVFEVTPKSGLSATTHSETITINSTANTSASFTASFEVAPKVLTVDVTIADKQYDGKTDATIEDAALVGVVGSDAVALADYSGITAAFAQTTVGENISVALTGSFALTGANKDNYTLTQPSNITGNIVNNFTGAGCYDTTPLNTDGWTNAETFDIVAKPGYELSITNTDLSDDAWDNSISYYGEATGAEATFYVRNKTTGAISLAVTERYSLDNTSPTAEIKIETNSFKQFVNTITFGLFFKENVDVTITGADALSGVARIEYQKVAAEADYDENGTWTDYAAFGVTQDEEFIVYARVTDKAGNQTLIRSDGVVVDMTMPAISGITNGESYYGDTAFTFSDAYLESVSVDGTPIDTASGSYTITADNAEHTITAKDKAGNETTVTITVYKQYSVTLTGGTGYTLAAQTGSASPVNYGGDYKFTLTLGEDYEAGAGFAVKANGTALTPENGVYTISNITEAVTVTVEGVALKGADYSEVDKAIAAAQALNAGNYTDFSAVTAAIDAVERGMDITKQAEVDAMAKTINDAIGALTAKPSDNPKTGDSGNMFLWIALLFISGGAAVTLTVYGRKRRNAAK